MQPKTKINLSLLIAGAFLCMLNQNLISPALPAIMAEFNLTADSVQWLSSGFTLTCALMIPLSAFLIERFPLRNLFTATLASFCLGSLLLGWGGNFATLLAGRLLQAAGAGVIMPLVQVIMLESFPVEKRGSAMGMLGLVIAMAPALGPVISGVIVDFASWRWLFCTVAGLAIFILLPAFALLNNNAANSKLHFDVYSLIYSTLGFGGLLYGFSAVSAAGLFSAKVIMALMVGVGALFLFVQRQNQLTEPFLNLQVLKNSLYKRAVILTMIANASLAGGTVLLPIFVQNICGHSVSVSGMIMAPGALLLGLLNPIAGRIFDKKGIHGLSICAFTMLTLGTLGFCFLSPDMPVFWITLLYMLRLLGVGLITMPLLTWSLNAVARELATHGVSVFNTLRQIGGALGTALLVAAMQLTDTTATVTGLNNGFALAAAGAALALLL